MSERLSPGVAARTAVEAARHAAMGDEARAMLSDGQSPEDYFEALKARALWTDAVRFLAGALAKREAVWWAYLCAREAHGGSPAVEVGAALDAARRWVVEPDEANRRGAEAAATKAGAGTPAGCAALAAFWAEGSLGPAGLEAAVPPADHLTPRGVSGAVMLAAVMTEPEKAEDKFRRFLALGSEVAVGANRWGSGPSRTSPPPGPAVPTRTDPAPRPPTRAGRRPDTWE